MLTSFIIPGISLGLSATSVPGPLQAYLLNITLRGGWRRGLWVTISPLLTDFPIIIVIVFLLGALPDAAIQVIRVLGGLLLLWIAWGAYQQVRSGANFGAADDDNPLTTRRIIGSAMMINVFSPGPYLFWSTVNGPLLLDALQQSLWHAAAFMLAFYTAFIGGMMLLAIVFDRVGSINPRFTALLLRFTVILLLFFGTRLIAEALQLVDAQQIVALFAAPIALIWLLWEWMPQRKQREI